MSQIKTNTPVPDNQKWKDEQFFRVLRKKHDRRFGEISILSHQETNQKIFMKERRFNDKASLQEAYNQANIRLGLQHPNILRMLGLSTSIEKGLCSTTFFLRTFFVYFDNDLRSEFAKRLAKKRMFNDMELQVVSDNIQMGLLETHVNGLIHGDVRPEMIGIMKDEKSRQVVQAVLLDRLSDNSQPSKLQTTRMINKQPLFISPELYKYINAKEKSKPIYGRQKNDLFSLGMSLLLVGTGNKKIQQVYLSKGDFDRKLLANSSNQFARTHGMNAHLCNSVNDYLGLQMSPVPIEERRVMESVEKTVVTPSNGQPPYQQVKVRNAEFVRKKGEENWARITSWKTIKTTVEETDKGEIVQHEILGKQETEVIVNAPVPGTRSLALIFRKAAQCFPGKGG